MKSLVLIAFILTACCTIGRAAPLQPRVNGVEVIKANGGIGTNQTLVASETNQAALRVQSSSAYGRSTNTVEILGPVGATPPATSTNLVWLHYGTLTNAWIPLFVGATLSNSTVAFTALQVSVQNKGSAAASLLFDYGTNNGTTHTSKVFSDLSGNTTVNSLKLGNSYVTNGNSDVQLWSGGGFFRLLQFTGDIYFGNGGSGAHIFRNSEGTSPVERMRLTGGGLLGVGSASPLARLHVTNSTTQVGVRNDQQATTNNVEEWFSNNARLAAMQTNALALYVPMSAPTNTAAFLTDTNDIVPGQIYVGPAQRFSLSFDAYATATLAAGAICILNYSNAAAGVIQTVGRFTIPSGILASDIMTNQLVLVNAEPNSMYWLTNAAGGQPASMVAGSFKRTGQ